MTTRTLMLGAFLAAVAAGAAEPKYDWKHEAGREVSLLADGRTVWTFHFAAEDNWPYFHPLALPGGPVLTGFAPKDHPWHHGLWFSWKYINGTNYWEYKDKKDPGSQPSGRTAFAGKEDVSTSPQGAKIGIDVEYSCNGVAVLKERRMLSVGMPRADGSYAIDWTSIFTAQERAVELNKDSGYAGLFFRGAADLKQLQYLNSAGGKATDVHAKPGTWIDLVGVVDPGYGPAGVTIFDHPDNFRHPTTWWRDRSKDDDEISYIGSAPLFTGLYVLPAGKSLTLRYRVLVHKGAADAPALDREFESYRLSK